MSQEETKNTPYGYFQGFVVAVQNGPMVAVIYTLYLTRPLKQFKQGFYECLWIKLEKSCQGDGHCSTNSLEAMPIRGGLGRSSRLGSCLVVALMDLGSRRCHYPRESSMLASMPMYRTLDLSVL